MTNGLKNYIKNNFSTDTIRAIDAFIYYREFKLEELKRKAEMSVGLYELQKEFPSKHSKANWEQIITFFQENSLEDLAYRCPSSQVIISVCGCC